MVIIAQFFLLRRLKYSFSEEASSQSVVRSIQSAANRYTPIKAQQAEIVLFEPRLAVRFMS